MGTITAKSIIDKASIQLLDPSNTRWTRSELLGWLNDGQRALILAIPETSSATSQVNTIAGARQTIPSSAWLLLRVTRNMGTSGTTSGRFLEKITEEHLTKANPTWTSDTATLEAKAFAYTPLDKTVFWVYPPSVGGQKLEVIYSMIPVDMVSETDVITTQDIYEPVLLDYVLYRACSKDAEYAAGVALAKNYLDSFQSFIAASQQNLKSDIVEMEKA